MSQALARKWRPRNFAELVGQEHVVRALGNALDAQRLHHAYLFTGTRGVGKTTLARILAKAFNCERGVSAQPCGVCSACTGIDGGRFVDLLEVDAASNTQVDKMRELLENAFYAPTAGRFKVYVIDEVHQLSGHSFNAMLKTLEEPPEHVKFVLATTDPQKVPVTVLSRCLQFNLRQIPAPQIRARLEEILKQEKVKFEGAALSAVAKAARGSLRDALSLLDQAIAHGGGQVSEQSVVAMLGLTGRTHLYRILEAVARRDGAGLMALADEMAAQGVAFEQALQELGTVLHRIAVAQVVPDAVLQEDHDEAAVSELARRFGPEEIQLYYQIAGQGRADMVLAPDEYAGFTMTLLRMLAFAPDDSRTTGVRAGTEHSSPASSSVAVDRQPDGKPRAQPLSADWVSTLAAIKISGMARQLAHNCELVGEADGVVELRLAETHRHLAEKGPQERLRGALEEHLGRPVRIRISFGQPTGPTPAQVDEEQRRSQIASAVRTLDADPFVRELVDHLGARVVPDSIKLKQ
jgi:DNA polymerase-3 subunit gamma/tau